MAVYVANISESAGIDQFFHVTDSRIEKKGMPCHSHPLFFVCQSADLFDLGHTSCHRLLHQDVLSRFQCPHGKIKVGSDRCGNDDGVCFRVLKDIIYTVCDLYCRIQSVDVVTPFEGKIDCGCHTASLVFNEISENVRSPVTYTYLGDLQHTSLSPHPPITFLT